MSSEITSTLVLTSDATFADVLKNNTLLVVDCYADWCGPCRVIGPFIEQLATEYTGRVTFAKVDVDASPMISRQFHISSIPTILFFKNGKLVDTVIGALPKHVLKDRVEALINS